MSRLHRRSGRRNRRVSESVNPWVQAGLSLAVGLLTATGALVGVRFSVRGGDRATQQRELAARREEWWRRFTWASELALDESPSKRGGWAEAAGEAGAV